MSAIRYCFVHCAALILVVAAVLLSQAFAANVGALHLGRVLIFDEGEMVYDSHLEPVRPRGTLIVGNDHAFAISALDFDAWLRNDDEVPFISNAWTTIDFVPNGARYEFFDLRTDELVFVHFLRRAPDTDDFDPATIFFYELADGRTVMLDYRYPKDEG